MAKNVPTSTLFFHQIGHILAHKTIKFIITTLNFVFIYKNEDLNQNMKFPLNTRKYYPDLHIIRDKMPI